MFSGELGGEHFRETASQVDAAHTFGQVFILQGAERGQLRPPGLQQVQGILVVKAEGAVLSHRDDGPLALGFSRERLRGLFCSANAGAGCDLEDTAHIDGLFNLLYQGVVPLAGNRAFHRGNQSQVPLRLDQCLVAGKVSQHRQAGGGLDLGFAKLQVAGAADTVQDNAGQVQTGIKQLVAQNLGGDAAGDFGSVGHQHDRRVDQLGQLGGGAFLVQAGVAVEDAHHALHHRHLSFAGGPLKKLQHRGVGQQPGIQVPARNAAGQGMVTGVDIVGAGLEGLHRQAPAGQRAHDAGGDGGLAHPATHAGNHHGSRHYLRSPLLRAVRGIAFGLSNPPRGLRLSPVILAAAGIQSPCSHPS